MRPNISVSICPYRGITKEEWEKLEEEFLSKIDSANNTDELYYALRHFGALSNDGHFDFPDMGVYNRLKFFQKSDQIFPVLVKTTNDDRVFVVRDYSGLIPDYSEILEVNGIDAKELSHMQHLIVPYEPNYAYAHLNEREEREFTTRWVSFSNYLFCEKIFGPFTVKYFFDDKVHTTTMNAMERHALHKLSKPMRKGLGLPLFKKPMNYSQQNDERW